MWRRWPPRTPAPPPRRVIGKAERGPLRQRVLGDIVDAPGIGGGHRRQDRLGLSHGERPCPRVDHPARASGCQATFFDQSLREVAEQPGRGGAAGVDEIVGDIGFGGADQQRHLRLRVSEGIEQRTADAGRVDREGIAVPIDQVGQFAAHVLVRNLDQGKRSFRASRGKARCATPRLPPCCSSVHPLFPTIQGRFRWRFGAVGRSRSGPRARPDRPHDARWFRPSASPPVRPAGSRACSRRWRRPARPVASSRSKA